MLIAFIDPIVLERDCDAGRKSKFETRHPSRQVTTMKSVAIADRVDLATLLFDTNWELYHAPAAPAKKEMHRFVLQCLFNSPVVDVRSLGRYPLPPRDSSGAVCPMQKGRTHGGGLAYFLDAMQPRSGASGGAAAAAGDSSLFRSSTVEALRERWNGEIFKEPSAQRCGVCSIFPIGEQGKPQPIATPGMLLPPLWVFDHFRRAPYDPTKP